MAGVAQATPTLPARTTRTGLQLSRYATDPEYAARKRAYAKAWAAANIERRRAAARARYAANPQVRAWLIAYIRAWRIANPDLRRAARTVHNRIRRLRQQCDADLTTDQWLHLLAAAGQCLYCGAARELTLDHVKALSRGGRHTLTNVAPACAECNGHKGTKTAAEWLGIPAATAFHQRHAQLVGEVKTWLVT